MSGQLLADEGLHQLQSSLEVGAGLVDNYGPNLRDLYRGLARDVNRTLRGARPEDLPVELPRTVEFVVNARTAKALGISLPQSIVLRADRVIE
jgi:putative ABC transport system substrate-binding protein